MKNCNMGTVNHAEETLKLRELVVEKIAFGEKLINSIEKYKSLEGIQKLQRKISQELNFLKQVSRKIINEFILNYNLKRRLIKRAKLKKNTSSVQI
jgi:hypothetical protein